VLWIWMLEEPLPVKMEVGVAARVKMSVGWMESRVWRVRYCFDCVGISFAIHSYPRGISLPLCTISLARRGSVTEGAFAGEELCGG